MFGVHVNPHDICVQLRRKKLQFQHLFMYMENITDTGEMDGTISGGEFEQGASWFLDPALGGQVGE